MAVIEVAKAPSKSNSKREIYAQVCYYYPQYTLKEVETLPQRDVTLLLQVANKIEGLKMLNLTQIAAAPHTKNGSGVKKLTSHFKKVAQNG
jgi:hypothetical protein